MTISPQPKGEDIIFQKALVNRTPGTSYDMCGRSGEQKCSPQLCRMLTCIKFKERYLLLSGNSDAQESIKSKKSKKGLRALLRELSDDEDNTTDTGPDIPEDPDRPWFRDFRAYMDAVEQVPDGWSAVKWWGVSLCTADD